MSTPSEEAMTRRGRSARGRLKDFYCLDCYYNLRGLESPGNCPECARPFNLLRRSTYSLEDGPRTFRQRLTSSVIFAFITALLAGVVAFVVNQTQMCFAVFLSAPFAAFEVAMFYTWSGFRRNDHSLTLWLITGLSIGTLMGSLCTFPYPWLGTIFGTIGGGFTGAAYWMWDDAY